MPRYLAYYGQVADERTQRHCDEVRQVTRALHAQGIYSGFKRVAARLTYRNDLYRAEAQATGHATLQDLGREG